MTKFARKQETHLKWFRYLSLCLLGHRCLFSQAFAVFNFKDSFNYQFPRLKMMCWVFYWMISVLPSVPITGSWKQYLYSSTGSKVLSPSNILDFTNENGKREDRQSNAWSLKQSMCNLPSHLKFNKINNYVNIT